MNAVGILYSKGLGVDSNFNSAVHWFTQAANNGYKKARINMGMLYKRVAADSAGYSIAVNHFTIALQQNEPSSFFALGYMYYKGLGCTQSYTQALNLFRQGIAQGRPDCMYFTGICFKYGYGVTANADSATFYINKAALKGYKQANAELAFNTNGTSGNNLRTKKNIAIQPLQVSEKPYQKQKHSKDFIRLEGTYNGYLTQYDYSGKLIVAKLPLTLELSAVGNKITGTWKQGNDEPVAIEAIQNGSTLVFAPSSFLTATIKAKRKQQRIVFRSAEFVFSTRKDSMFLNGSVQLYNTVTRETDKPLSVQLVQPGKRTADFATSSINVYPNPVTKGFSVGFALQVASAVKINIYNTQGQLVFTKLTGMLQPGKQVLQMENNLPTAGIYILSVNANSLHATTAFIKE